MDINRQLLTFTICIMAFSCLSAIIPTVVTNGLSYSYVQSPRRACTVVGNSTQTPSFFERRTNAFECELSVGLAISHSRYQIADGLIFSKVRKFPLSIDSLPNCPCPYSVNKINLTNMVARVFAFSTCPIFATNELKVALVSFYNNEIGYDNFLYALYVNECTGNVSDTIQGCSGYMEFLSNSWPYPFLDEVESVKQRRFFSSLNNRRYNDNTDNKSHYKMLQFEATGISKKALSNASIDVDIGDL